MGWRVNHAQPETQTMNSRPTPENRTPSEKHSIIPTMLTPKEAAHRLRLSPSWLAKARMRGDGPPYILIGRAVRYSESALFQWLKSCQRSSTSEHSSGEFNGSCCQTTSVHPGEAVIMVHLSTSISFNWNEVERRLGSNLDAHAGSHYLVYS